MYQAIGKSLSNIGMMFDILQLHDHLCFTNAACPIRIPEALNKRSELNLLQLPNDNYFHYYIGYHLKGAGTAYHPLYKQLYNDFGFLEQKLRYSGLSNTLGDFKLYGDQICDRSVFDDLTEFLAYIEEYLSISEDTCLLQYALSKDRYIGALARQQAERFNDRIWFSDK